ncbi:YbfB/YjiJ family MFS transporter [Hylemonella gracilis]|uniref:Major facilitator superfamily permease n=1 Tax=Hylemonella gracilis ATCC 19624 TaxID=887062 RepID=F3KV63_9BURK|nr:YbfB/YjiJ family MFS transporter [Hylemonella gracilis]EGI76338.1 major facilitator superfamily permease [Hylemonella gracilis ATCC 19624]
MPSAPAPLADEQAFVARHPILTALALSLGTAIALGVARFSYALLLTPMRDDLGWSYLVAGGMNTGNALGYLLGALATPLLMRRLTAHRVLILGAFGTALLTFVPGFVTDTTAQLALRVVTGLTSAFLFVAGGLLVSRLAALHAQRAGLLLGLYYGGTGLGIVAAALLLPPVMQAAAHEGAPHPWQWAWWLLGALALLASAIMALPTRHIPAPATQTATGGGFRAGPLKFGLLGYLMFGLGYIGYMTFVIAMLKETGMTSQGVTVFFTLLGVATFASSRIWARLLDRFRGGQSLAILNGLLCVATLLPAWTAQPGVVFASGILFGACFLSAVASTTAMVRHNLPPAHWPAGISAFTIVFAAGQIVGPTIVGWIADAAGGLQRGLLFSAVALGVGALLAGCQRALPPPR